jgi:peptide/nickel transport system substrate-binding protein
MASKDYKKVFKKKYTSGVNQFEQLTDETTAKFEKNFIKRLNKLEPIWKFVSTWLIGSLLVIFLVIIQIIHLSVYFQTNQFVPGGNLKEGILGSYSNCNPIYASTAVDSSVSNLVFAGLLKYDNSNNLVPSLASSYSVNQSGRDYTFKLKPNLKWQDGKSLTSNDVAFTFKLIQSPDAQSPLFSSWKGITITTPDLSTIVFSLPTPLSSFPYSLTTGILPKHILSSISPANMRTINFDTVSPVGSGPFSLVAVRAQGNTPDTAQQTIELRAYKGYWQGPAKLNGITIEAFRNKAQMIDTFKSKKIDTMSGLVDIPKSSNNAKVFSVPLTASNMIFLKTSDPILSDLNVRKALLQATNKNQIIGALNYATKIVYEPLLKEQLGYDAKYAQAGYDPKAAESALNNDGWVKGADGIRYKSGKPLTIILSSPDSNEAKTTDDLLKIQWRNVGVDLRINALSDSDLKYAVSYHNYQALQYGISIGVDPDVYTYWDSSQTDPRSPFRLNLSEYSSKTADESLQAGRTRLDPTLRAIKYQQFLQSWQSDVPAIGLYQPRYLYVSNLAISGLNPTSINSDSDRYNNVVNWEIRQAKVTNTKK